MSPVASLSAAWAAVYLYLCGYYCVLHLRRRTEREYLSFGLMSGAMSFYALGRALEVDAVSIAQSTMAQQLEVVGLLPAVAFFVDFAHQVVARARGPLVSISYMTAAFGVLATVAGYFLDPGHAPALEMYSWRGVVPRYLAQLHPIGAALLVIGFALAAYGTLLILARARKDTDARIVASGSIVVMIAGGHDLIVRSAPLDMVLLVEHAYLIFAIGVSYVLVGRFVRTANALTSRTLELRRSYNELRDAQEALVRKEQLATMGELSAVIAHEVRNPLAIIKNAVSGLHRPNLRDADRGVLLKILDEEADRLNRLVGDLLAYARPVAPQTQSVDVEELVRTVLELARNAAPARGELMAFDLSFVDSKHTIQGDPDLLKQALVNIVENALQAMPEGGTLTVRTSDTTIDGQSAVAIAVRDTGEGMDTLVRSKATDPFFTTRPTGTGLGLAIVHRLIQSHGGKVQIESAYGTGTTVTVILPERGPQRTSLSRDTLRPAASAKPPSGANR